MRVEENIVEAALFNSGGPLIVVPYIPKAAQARPHYGNCSDGGRASSHAIHDAMPLLDGRTHRGRHRQNVPGKARITSNAPI